MLVVVENIGSISFSERVIPTVLILYLIFWGLKITLGLRCLSALLSRQP